VPQVPDITQATITFGSYTAHPNATGHYQVDSVLAATYSMTVSYTGYETGHANNFVVAADSTTIRDFQLYRLDPASQLNGVFDRSVPEIRLQWMRPTWTEPVDALTGYEVWLGTTRIATGVADTLYTYHVTTSRQYDFYVKAVYAGGVSDSSNHYRLGVDLAVDDIYGGIPNDYYLRQNFPNPFNPSTSISYGLPKAADVRIEVFNVLGQKVETMVQAHQEAGNYRVIFDASKLGTGIYYYRIQAGDFQMLRKMLLMR
jgi:hypothetical protein